MAAKKQSKPSYKKITEHIDREEIIAKLCIGISPKDINEWLAAKYSEISQAKYVISERLIKRFADTYLDFYNDMKTDLISVKTSMTTGNELDDAVKSNPAYKDALTKVAQKELDIDSVLMTMAINVETRISQIYDMIQEDSRSINTKIDRVWIEYIDTLGNLLDKYHKWKESKKPDSIVQTNITLQVVDQHISVFHDVIREILESMDLESSQYFLEIFQEKMSKLKEPTQQALTQDAKAAEVRILNESINKRLNE